MSDHWMAEFFRAERVTNLHRRLDFQLAKWEEQKSDRYRSVRDVASFLVEFGDLLTDYCARTILPQHAGLVRTGHEGLLDFLAELGEARTARWYAGMECGWVEFRGWVERCPEVLLQARRWGRWASPTVQWVLFDGKGWGVMVNPITGAPMRCQVREARGGTASRLRAPDCPFDRAQPI